MCILLAKTVPGSPSVVSARPERREPTVPPSLCGPLACAHALVLLLEGEDPLLLVCERQSSALVQEPVLLAERAAGGGTTGTGASTLWSCSPTINAFREKKKWDSQVVVLAVLGADPGNVVVVAGQTANGAGTREQSHAGLLLGVTTQAHHR